MKIIMIHEIVAVVVHDLVIDNVRLVVVENIVRQETGVVIGIVAVAVDRPDAVVEDGHQIKRAPFRPHLRNHPVVIHSILVHRQCNNQYTIRMGLM